jgi:hypothetical protein
MDSRVKFGKETIAGAYKNPKWVPYYGAQVDSGRAQALLGLFSDILAIGSGILTLSSG